MTGKFGIKGGNCDYIQTTTSLMKQYVSTNIWQQILQICTMIMRLK